MTVNNILSHFDTVDKCDRQLDGQMGAQKSNNKYQVAGEKCATYQKQIVTCSDIRTESKSSIKIWCFKAQDVDGSNGQNDKYND